MEEILSRLQSLEENEAKNLKRIDSLEKDVETLEMRRSALRTHLVTMKTDLTETTKDLLILKDSNSSLQHRIARLELPALEAALALKEAAHARLSLCLDRKDQAEINLKTFRSFNTDVAIAADEALTSQLVALKNALSEAWRAYLEAKDAACPKTFEDLLWIMAKAGHTALIAPLMNLSKATRNCDHLQSIMMNVKMGTKENTQLHHCADKGMIASVKRLLTIRNIDVDARNKRKKTPLSIASCSDYEEIVRMLVDKGADVNVKDDMSHTPVIWAAINENVNLIRLFAEKGADLDAKDVGGFTALHNAVNYGSSHLPVIRELVLTHRVDINAKNEDGKTPLGQARRWNRREVMEFLRSNGGLDDGIPAGPYDGGEDFEG
jgi:hypothetical protein